MNTPTVQLFASLNLTLGAAMALLADRAAWRITAPLEQLARDLAAQRASTDGPGLPGAAATDEIGLLRQELEHNMRLAAITREQLEQRAIRWGNHCFGCTAGQGSSCAGATA